MQTRQLGSSDLHPTILTYGTWNISGHPFWKPVPKHDAIAVIRRACERGVRCFDTAPVYGFGYAEEVLAEALEPMRHSVIIATKVGLRWDGDSIRDIRNDLTATSIAEELHLSLRRLRTDCIDLYQVHWPDPATSIAETFDTLARLKEQGKIRHIGVSNFTVPMMEEARRHVEVISLQPRYNLLDRSIERAHAAFCQAHTMGILAYSPLASGLLSGRFHRGSTFDDWRAVTSDVFRAGDFERHLDVVERLRPLADEAGLSLSQLAIAWVLSRTAVTSVIIGAGSIEHLEHNLCAIDATPSPDLLTAIDAITTP